MLDCLMNWRGILEVYVIKEAFCEDDVGFLRCETQTSKVLLVDGRANL